MLISRNGTSAPAPVGSVAAPTCFELLRAITGRRTLDQIRNVEWTADPSPYDPVFSLYGMPDCSLNE